MNVGDQVDTPEGAGVIVRFEVERYPWRAGLPHRQWWTWVRYPDGSQRPWPAGSVRRLAAGDPLRRADDDHMDYESELPPSDRGGAR